MGFAAREALHIAAYKGNLDIIKLLLFANANIYIKNINNNYAFDYIVTRNHIEIITFFIKEYFTIRQIYHFVFPILYKSIVNNKLQFIENILLGGFDINMYDYTGENLLHIACEHQNIDIIKLLIKYGININNKNILDESPIDIVIRLNNKEIIKFFLNIVKN